jgi:hypothetical protein
MPWLSNHRLWVLAGVFTLLLLILVLFPVLVGTPVVVILFLLFFAILTALIARPGATSLSQPKLTQGPGGSDRASDPELRSDPRRSVHRMNSRLIVVTLMASAMLVAACGSRIGTTPTPSAASLSSGAIQVTTAPSCPGQQQQGGREIDLFPLGVTDNGRAYTLVRCQAVDALLLHPKEDGCRWTSVQSSDAAVVAILPIPLPLPPGGSTNEAFIAGAPGQATLSSSLVCSSGAPQQWQVTLKVLSKAPARASHLETPPPD